MTEELQNAKGLTLYNTIPTFDDPKEEGFGKHYFLLFPCFLLYQREKSSF